MTGIQVTPEELLAVRYDINTPSDFPVSFSPLAGNGYSGAKGSGSDLYGIREYQQGDICKKINRQATARTGILHLNEYVEDRLLSAYILTDQSTLMFFTSTHVMKSVIGARKTAEILFYYLENGHRASGEVFNEDAYFSLPLTNSEAICEEWIATVAEYNMSLPGKDCKGRQNSLIDALVRMLESEITGREIYIISDFINYEVTLLQNLLTTLCSKNRIYLLQITDRLEDNPPLKQWLNDGKNEFMLNNGNERSRYLRIRECKRQKLIDFSKDNNIEIIELFT